jgi:hypothetical protein
MSLFTWKGYGRAPVIYLVVAVLIVVAGRGLGFW